MLDDYVNVVRMMEQWAALSSEAKQIICICLAAIIFGLWLMIKMMHELDIRERKQEEALRDRE